MYNAAGAAYCITSYYLLYTQIFNHTISFAVVNGRRIRITKICSHLHCWSGVDF